MSALLSLSTDNAKELCLAKINAGTSMIGMYLYGAAIGMDFKVMNQIIASPLGFTVAKLLNSNEFTMQRGKTSINSVLEYLRMGPSKADLNRFKQSISRPGVKGKLNTFSLLINALKQMAPEKSELEGVLKQATGNENIMKELSEYNIGYVLAKLVQHSGPNMANDIINQVRTKVNAEIAKLLGKNGYAVTDAKYLNFKSINN
jgi:hypothetical protein